MRSFPVSCTSCNDITPCKEIQDSLGFWIPCLGFTIPGTGFWILCQQNLDSRFLELYSGFVSPGFHMLKLIFPRFWIQQAKISQIPQFGFPYIKGKMIGSLQSQWWQQWSRDYRQPSCFPVQAHACNWRPVKKLNTSHLLSSLLCH